MLFFCVLNGLYCQNSINGKYTSLMGLQGHYNYFDFNKKGTFYFESGGDVSISSLAKGSYIVTKDSLILNYNLTELKTNSYYKSKTYFNIKDSITVKFKVHDSKSQLLSNVFLDAYPNYKSTKVGKDGSAMFKFKKATLKDVKTISIDAEFYDRLDISLTLDRNYEIEVFLSTSGNMGFYHPKAIKGQIEKYKIIERTDTYLKLKKGDKTIEWKKVQ